MHIENLHTEKAEKTMTKEFIISLVLDKRRIKKDGTFPVKLRVFMPETKKQKLYSTIFNFSEKEFKAIWQNLKVKSEYKELNKKFNALVVKAENVADSLNTFTFQDFERLMYGSTGTAQNVNFYFQKIIDEFKAVGSISTAKSYENSLSCIQRFAGKINLNFKDITVQFLENFEDFCIDTEEKSITTVSIYTRNLRAVFNRAISDKVISNEIYPFGRNKYKIKTSSKVKKALTTDEIKKLFEGTPSNEFQEKAKAFWFFSYLCNGMNIKDIIQLKCKNIDKEKIKFVRAKTETTRYERKEIEVYLNEFTQNVINTYGNPNGSPEDYVFPVLAKGMNAETQRKVKINFNSTINVHFDNYAKELGFSDKITTYWARHSFSTIAIQKGMSIEFVGEALGHTDIKTTMNYFDGFEKEAKKKISNILLDF